MILGICSGPVYITLTLFIIVLETGSMLVATSRSDKYNVTNNATSGRPAVTRTENCIAVKKLIRHF